VAVLLDLFLVRANWGVLLLSWRIVLVVRTFDLLLTTEITIPAVRLLHVSTPGTSCRTTTIEIIVAPLSPAPLRWKAPLIPPSIVHPASAATDTSTAILHFLVIFTIFIRLPLFEVFIGVASPTLASSIRLETFPVLSLWLVGVSITSSDGGTSSSAVIEHQSLATSVRRLLTVKVFFVSMREMFIFLRLTSWSLRRLNDHEFFIILRGLSMIVPLVA